jgi:hypothetical protein
MRAVQRRGTEIFLLAFLFRSQSFVLSHGAPWKLLKVDILNIMGLSIVAGATIWGLCGTPARRLAAFAAATVAFVWLAPAVRAFDALAVLPDFLEGYIRPVEGLSNFTFFPWTAFVMAGAVVGVLIDGARTPEADRRLNLALLGGGLVMAAAAYQASFLPPIDTRSRFWTTSASFFFLRAGLMVAAIGVAYLWEQRPWRHGWSPLQLLGRSSLFVYWIHVEMVYGLISLPLHHSLGLTGAWTALGLFSVLMVAVALTKDWVKGKYNGGSGLRQKLDGAVQA